MALKKINYHGSSKVIIRLCEMVNQLIDGGGGGGGSTVTYTSLLSSGTKTGEIEIDGVSTDMYAPTPPTKLSDLSNDAGFIDNTVNNLVNYYKKTETYTQAEVNALISAIVTLNILVVQTLPTQDISTTTIYLVPKATAETQDVYDEYIYVNNAWEHIGSTQVDLSDYYTKTETDALLDDKVDKVAGKQLSTEDFTSALKSKLEGIEAGAQANVQADWNQTDNTADDYIKNKPTIPSGSGHTILDSSGTSMAQRTNMQFSGVDVSDDSTNDKTIIDANHINDNLYVTNSNFGTAARATIGRANKIGAVTLHSSNEYTSTILNNGTLTANRTLTPPDKNGTIATTDDIPTDASDVTYDNTQSGLTATNVQDAIDEVAQGGGGGSYSAGDGIDIINNEISVDTAFTEASTRANIASGDTLSTIWGKIKKFFSDLKTVAFSGSYNDLSNTPTLNEGYIQWINGSQMNQIPFYSSLQQQSLYLANVALSGSYNDLSNKPTIPTNNNQLTNGAGYITSAGSCASATNSDKVDGSHAWEMQTLSAAGQTHGSTDWVMKCQHNVDGDSYFKIFCGNKSIGTKVDYASSTNIYNSLKHWEGSRSYSNGYSDFSIGSNILIIAVNGYANYGYNFCWARVAGYTTWRIVAYTSSGASTATINTDIWYVKF